MRSRWQIWKETLRVRILLVFCWMGVTLVATGYIAKSFAGEKGLDLVRIQLSSEATFNMSLSPWIVALLVVWGGLVYWLVWPKGQGWEAKEITIDVAKIGSLKLTPNQEVAGLAHRAWCEIVSRKAGIVFDEENDVIVEVYDSWYKLFGEVRALVKAIPVEKLRASADARQLCDYLLKALNAVLRPHLTRYQARFRAWYENEMKDANGKAPQELQKSYPQYKELVQDLKKTNAAFLEFEKALRDIARGKE
jgi:hypothetical protein